MNKTYIFLVLAYILHKVLKIPLPLMSPAEPRSYEYLTTLTVFHKGMFFFIFKIYFKKVEILSQSSLQDIKF